MDKKYYVRFKGRVIGPMSTAKTRDLVRVGNITSSHELSTDRTNWGKSVSFIELYPKDGQTELVNAEVVAGPGATGTAKGQQTASTARSSISLETGNYRTMIENVDADAGEPTDFGRYRLLQQLGVGGMGTVYLAHDSELDRRVALKLPHTGNTTSTQSERFRREARMSATLDHPNICRIFDIGEYEGRMFLTMAFIEGSSLHDIIQSRGPVDACTAASLMCGIANAVQFAHSHDIIHRDLKPANIMIQRNGHFVIMDFGLARRIEQTDQQITATGAVIGTPAYMSPEQLRGDENASGPKSDVYSLGVILYELLVGQRPFRGTLPQIYSQVLAAKSVRPSAEHLDPKLCDICAKATMSNAADRFETAAEFSSSLNNYLISIGKNPSSSESTMQLAALVGTAGDVSPVSPPPSGQSLNTAKRSYAKWLWPIIIAVCCMSLLLGALLIYLLVRLTAQPT